MDVLGKTGVRPILSVKLVGTLNVVRLVAAAMAATDSAARSAGVIVNTASVQPGSPSWATPWRRPCLASVR